MKILSPINKVDEVEKVIEAGADEIYCGVIFKELLNTYTRLGTNSAIGYTHSDLNDYKELEQVIKIAHSHGVPVFLVLNSRNYNETQYEILLESIDITKKLNVDAFIISDIGLILTLKNLYRDIKIHASVISSVMNSKCVKFYKKLGVNRITLQGWLKTSEVLQISKKTKKVELEIFPLIPTPCPNIEGLCNFTHGINNLISDESTISNSLLSKSINKLPKNLFNYLMKYKRINSGATPCSFEYKMLMLSNHSKHKIQKINLNYSHQGCAACRLYDLNRPNIKSVKIDGRSLPTSKKVLYVYYLKKLIEQLNKIPNKDKFLQYSKKLCRKINLQKLNKCCYEHF